MKKIILFCIISLSVSAQKITRYQYIMAVGYNTAYNLTEGEYVICVGKSAGFYLTKESYCIIIGSDSISQNIKGKDMLWYVDYNDSFLKKYTVISYMLNHYDLKKDNIERRKQLIKAIQFYAKKHIYFI